MQIPLDFNEINGYFQNQLHGGTNFNINHAVHFEITGSQQSKGLFSTQNQTIKENSMNHIDSITQFYLDHISEAELKNNILQAPCPFCKGTSNKAKGKIIVYLNPDGFFFGYFRCLERCIHGGFPLHFARMFKIDPRLVPGFDPDREPNVSQVIFPVKNNNNDVKKFMSRMTDEMYERFDKMEISSETLEELQIGYNGRYLVYPYIQTDGNCYSARCVHPERPEDSFWFGNNDFATERFRTFNTQEIDRCEDGTLIIVEGEDNLLTLKQLGLPGIAVSQASDLETLDIDRLSWLHTIFLCINNSPESDSSARVLATKLGFRARIIRWQEPVEKNFCLTKLAENEGENFRKQVLNRIKESKSFSPFSSPEREHLKFLEGLDLQTSDAFNKMSCGFSALDTALGGIHGINIIGGSPKTGKSCFMIQVASEMARQKIPVIYYDFENGRQKIYQRTLCRLSRLSLEQIKDGNLSTINQQKLYDSQELLKQMLPWFRVVTDRKLTPEIMRRHIDFLRHETNNKFTVVVIDSLHKLPFKDFSERRTGIDAWLRQMEAIRDELNVTFLVISELSRGQSGKYDQQPHLGSFKGSGDIGYSADNAMVIMPEWDLFDTKTPQNERINSLWLVASREQSPGRIASYWLDYPYWGFIEKND